MRRSKNPKIVLFVVALAPLAFLACDALKKKDADAGSDAPAVEATATAAATATTTTTATTTSTAMATATTPPGTRVVKLADGGTALVNDAGKIIVDASALSFGLPGDAGAWTLPSGAPSAIVVPSTIPIPSQLTIPSTIPVPSGLTIPPFPGAGDAGKK
jgi:hypothetical protein